LNISSSRSKNSRLAVQSASVRAQDLVKFQNQQYSLDKRRWWNAEFILYSVFEVIALDCFYIPGLSLYIVAYRERNFDKCVPCFMEFAWIFIP
jgi:hypothetical protein